MAPPTPRAPFDLRSASITLTALVLKTIDVASIATELQQRYGAGLFEDEPLLIDLGALDGDSVPDFAALLPVLQAHGLRAIALRRAGAAAGAAGAAAGLIVLSDLHPPPAAREAAAAAEADTTTHEVPATGSPPGDGAENATVAVDAPANAPADVAPARPERAPTLVLDKPLRSGQQAYARGGDLVVLAPVSFGAEVIADGHVHVYAPLRGRAIAGARGDTSARIFSTQMEPQLVAIAGVYRTIESALPSGVHGRPGVVRLDGERLVIEPLGA